MPLSHELEQGRRPETQPIPIEHKLLFPYSEVISAAYVASVFGNDSLLPSTRAEIHVGIRSYLLEYKAIIVPMTIFHSLLVGRIELTNERKLHIFTAHPELKRHTGKIGQVLRAPDEIRRSRFDPDVLLFYKYFARIKSGKYISVTVKTRERNFILTSYITDVIKAGEIYENENEKKPI